MKRSQNENKGFGLLFYHRMFFYLYSSPAFFALQSIVVKGQLSKHLQSKYIEKMLKYSKNVETLIVTCDETHTESVNGLHIYPLTLK